ncbi:MAG: DUF4349 domain-containing protein [Pyrinomonadaceae bacterium]|nr:DUF4349 domain-containing protein [Pyrinomonadaceae bacterium]
MRKNKFFTFLLVFTSIFASCESSNSAQNTESASVSGSERMPERDLTTANSNTAKSTEPETAKPLERKIIKNAELRLESQDPVSAQQTIAQIVESRGGYVVESTQSGSDASSVKRDTVTMSLRIPSEKFNETLDEIRKTASRIVIETVSGQDVTEEFIDVEARLKAKKALEEQFLEIMKRSNSVEDALNVQREIADVRAEIEKIEGRKRFLENQASLSTIKVTVQTPNAIAGSSKGFFYRLTDSIGNGLDVALSFVLFFVSFLIAVIPFLILVVLPIVLVIRYFLKRSANKITAAPKSADAIVKDEIKN